MTTEMNQTVYAVLHYLKDQIQDHIHTNGAIPLVNGTQTTTTSNWTGETSDLSALVDGCAIRYYLPTDSTINIVSLSLKLSDGTVSTLPVFIDASRRATIEFNAGALITLVYRSHASLTTGWYIESDGESEPIANTDIDSLF